MLHVCMHLIKNAKIITIIMIWTNAGKRNIVLHTSEISTQQVTHSKLSLKAFVFQTATQWENESSRRPSKTQKNKIILIFYQSLPENNQWLLEINKLSNEDYSCDVLYTLINFKITWFLKKLLVKHMASVCTQVNKILQAFHLIKQVEPRFSRPRLTRFLNYLTWFSGPSFWWLLLSHSLYSGWQPYFFTSSDEMKLQCELNLFPFKTQIYKLFITNAVRFSEVQLAQICSVAGGSFTFLTIHTLDYLNQHPSPHKSQGRGLTVCRITHSSFPSK